MNLLITGATGLVGSATVRHLIQLKHEHNVILAVRSPERALEQFNNQVEYRLFDFESPEMSPTVFEDIDVLFLLRPPHLADVTTYFDPLLDRAKQSGIRFVVFLSVQGVEKSSIIPHHKIEKCIRKMGFQFVFIRPSYFMQNLTTTLFAELEEAGTISVPSGKAVFNWIDVEDIAAVIARVLIDVKEHCNSAITCTGFENLGFEKVVSILNQVAGTQFRYRPVNPIQFYFLKLRSGMSHSRIVVMLMLHWLPRFRKAPKIHPDVQQVLNRDPTSLLTFIEREKEHFISAYGETKD